jgi:hypothetical protein
LGLLASVTLLAAPVLAQETIVDPENPDVEFSEPHEDATEPVAAPARTLMAEGGDSSETLFDPDNPDVGGPGPESGAGISGSASSGGAARSGYVSGTYRLVLSADTVKESSLEDVYEIHNTLSLRVRENLGSESSAVLSARLAHGLLFENAESGRDLLPGPLDDAEHVRGLSSARLEDAYVSTRFDRLLLRVGQQRIVWGSSDIMRPSDVVGPLDLSSLSGSMAGDMSGASTSAPILAVKADYVVTGIGAAQVVVVPFFEPHRVDPLSTDFSLARPESALASRNPIISLLSEAVDPSIYEVVESALVGTEIPEQTPENVSVGGRLSTTVAGVDFATGYLFGWDRVPVLAIDPALSELLTLFANEPGMLAGGDFLAAVAAHPEIIALQSEIAATASEGGKLLSASYERWHVFTADSTFYVGPVGVRVDAALTPARTFYTEALEAVRPPALNSAFGLSYEGDSGQIAIIGEGFWLHVFDGDQRSQELLLFGNDYYGVSTALRVDLGHWDVVDLTIQLGGQLNLRDLDSVASAQAVYRFDGDTRVLAGASFFNRPMRAVDRLTFGDLYATNDSIFVGFEQGF